MDWSLNVLLEVQCNAFSNEGAPSLLQFFTSSNPKNTCEHHQHSKLKTVDAVATEEATRLLWVKLRHYYSICVFWKHTKAWWCKIMKHRPWGLLLSCPKEEEKAEVEWKRLSLSSTTMGMEHVNNGFRENQATWILEWCETVSFKTNSLTRRSLSMGCLQLRHTALWNDFQKLLIIEMPNGCCKIAAAGHF